MTRKRTPEQKARRRQLYAERERATGLAWRKKNAARLSAYRKRWEAENRERLSARMREWREGHPEQWTEIQRRAKQRQAQKKLARLEDAAGRPKPATCDVCGNGGQLAFDHDHNIGAFRGWLCHGCNLAIGNARDNPELLEKLARYLRDKFNG